MTTSRTALVTGASSGIGAEFARHLAGEGLDLVLVACRKDKLDALAAELIGRHRVGVHVVAADLSDPSTPRRIVDDLDARGLEVDVLINNAGLSGSDAFLELWQESAEVVREGWTSVEKGKPVCVPGRVNKVMSHAMRPVPFRAQYVLGRTFNPFKH